MGRGDKEVKWSKGQMVPELEQSGSKPTVPGRHCHSALGSFASFFLSPDTHHGSVSLMDRPACDWVWLASRTSVDGA